MPEKSEPKASRRDGLRVWLTVDGTSMEAREGDSVAAALLAAGQRILRYTSRNGKPRGLFCGMGTCFECLMQIDGRPNQQACLTRVADGMTVETQRGSGRWEMPR